MSLSLTYLLSVTVHILAAAVWLGSGVFLAAGVLPYFRSRLGLPAMVDYLAWATPRLRWIGWTSIALLVVTGVINLAVRGFAWADVSGRLWGGPFGQLLAYKLALVGVLLVLSAVHDLYLGVRTLELRARAPASPEAQRMRRWTMIAGQLIVVLAIAVVALAVMLVRGPPP